MIEFTLSLASRADPIDHGSLTRWKMILSTGSPLWSSPSAKDVVVDDVVTDLEFQPVELLLVQLITRLSLTNAETVIWASLVVMIARSVPQSVNTVSRPITENVRLSLTVMPREVAPVEGIDPHPVADELPGTGLTAPCAGLMPALLARETQLIRHRPPTKRRKRPRLDDVAYGPPVSVIGRLPVLARRRLSGQSADGAGRMR